MSMFLLQKNIKTFLQYLNWVYSRIDANIADVFVIFRNSTQNSKSKQLMNLKIPLEISKLVASVK